MPSSGSSVADDNGNVRGDRPDPRSRLPVRGPGVGGTDAIAWAKNLRNRQATSQVAFLTSSRMRLEVADAYTGSLPTSDIFDVSVKTVGDAGSNNTTSSVVELSLVSTDPRGAATLVNTYAQTYVSVRRIACVPRSAPVVPLVKNRTASSSDG